MSPSSSTGWRTTVRRRLVSGHAGVIIDIQRQPGANVIDVVQQIRAEIPKVQRAIPAGVKLTVVSDRKPSPIRASVHDVQFTLILSVVLVTLVVLLFLRSLAGDADRRRGAAAVADHRASASCISRASASTTCR